MTIKPAKKNAQNRRFVDCFYAFDGFVYNRNLVQVAYYKNVHIFGIILGACRRNAKRKSSNYFGQVNQISCHM